MSQKTAPEDGDKGLSGMSPSENEQRILQKYGRLPQSAIARSRRLSRERKYFDSGDMALSSVGLGSGINSNDPVHTGTEHPHRESISRPYAPVPNTSNVSEGANSEPHHQEHPLLKKAPSHLDQHVDQPLDPNKV
ncbi:uncharacterized protein BJX67DRAFT_346927 [Aspergillus lucknowensis]|uniref:mRNA stability protein n=1 Tax=Aspergillus lucknowensis TaxID=176173 RepID=A0ABR4LZZ6_9EURO